MNKLILSLLFISLYLGTSAQTINKGDFAINSSIENILGKYNIGAEYFFGKLKIKGDPNKKNNTVSLLVNVGVTNTSMQSVPLSGTSINTELRWYSQTFFKPSWNEFIALKLDIGNYSWNQTSVKSSFIGLSMGSQPKLFGNLHAFFQTDIGFYKNMPNRFGPLFKDPEAIFINEFGIGANVGLSFFIGKKK